MKIRWEGLRRTIVETGGVVATGEPAVLTTVLGSCVSVCLLDVVRKVGGMNHFLLPGDPAEASSCTRFGVNAMEVLVNRVMALGGQRFRLQAKVFGGCKVLRGVSSQDPGALNVAFALKFLKNEGIPIAAHLLRLNQPLEVNFLPHEGKVFLRRLAVAGVSSIAREEEMYRSRVRREMQSEAYGSVDLF